MQSNSFPKATKGKEQSRSLIRTNKISRINEPSTKKSARLRSIPKLMNYAMKALVYEEPWKMTLRDLPKPDPAPGEVVIKMESVGICGSGVHGFTGESGRRAPGMVMGHEVVGRVVERADDVTDRAIGQRVTVFNVLSDEAPSAEEETPVSSTSGWWASISGHAAPWPNTLPCPPATPFPYRMTSPPR